MNPKTYEDAVITNIRTELSLADRLRVLWHGQVLGKVRVETEHVVGATSTEAELWIPPIIPRKREIEVRKVQGVMFARAARANSPDN